jgi:hypothetical protein
VFPCITDIALGGRTRATRRDSRRPEMGKESGAEIDFHETPPQMLSSGYQHLWSFPLLSLPQPHPKTHSPNFIIFQIKSRHFPAIYQSRRRRSVAPHILSWERQERATQSFDWTQKFITQDQSCAYLLIVEVKANDEFWF